MRVQPVVEDAAAVVTVVAESEGQALLLHGELDVDVYRLHPLMPRPTYLISWPGYSLRASSGRSWTLSRMCCNDSSAPNSLPSAARVPIPCWRSDTADTCSSPSTSSRRRLPVVVSYWPGVPACSARLSARSGARLPAGGGWHRLGPTPSREIDQALVLGERVGPSVGQLVDALADADDGTGLPEGLIHADLTPPNVIPQGDQPPVIIDWIGVGRGPRIWPLAFLLYAAGPTGARRTLDRYARTLPLSEEEYDRLPAVMIARPLTLALSGGGVRTDDRQPSSQPLPCPPHPCGSDRRGSE